MENKETIRVSVIVPVYNADAIFADALDSILQQSLEKIEILAVDDGSKDHSADILKEYEKIIRIRFMQSIRKIRDSQRRETMHWRWHPESSWRLWTVTIT